ncbi:hypothetical protein FDP41_004300 [Naegleria fowleri]|uniref:Uncharacterized protein n=1 Tax=Naegleria fowleri TaxID=5763 RepID=A0A6A5BQ96_NAEFO|nr:uncharacterized protein FDP41_004300 [Naegleria fowleri]KAF0976401.1 hypothetical protein FDP41_004300 [Naegleria fowleri]CAG4716161.1 unnamed protein product [Naegleria fowleri]
MSQQQCCNNIHSPEPILIQQQIMTGLSIDPQTGEPIYTYSQPNIGGGKFSGENIEISVEPCGGTSKQQQQTKNSYRVVVHPHSSKKVLSGISAVKVLDSKSQKVLASLEDYNSKEHSNKDCIEVDFVSSCGHDDLHHTDIEVHVEWKCNTMDRWPPTLKTTLKVDQKKKVSSLVKVK